MKEPKRGQIVLASALVHGVVLFLVVWLARGLDAFRLLGPWVALVSASVALGVEAGRRRETKADRRVLESVAGLGLLAMAVWATLVAVGGLPTLLAAVLIGMGISLRIMAIEPTERLPYPAELGLAALSAGFVLLIYHPYAIAAWLAIIVVTIVRVRR